MTRAVVRPGVVVAARVEHYEDADQIIVTTTARAGATRGNAVLVTSLALEF